MGDTSGTYNPDRARAVVSRYSDAFLVARTITGLGDTIKALGIAIGLVLALPALLFAFNGGGGILVAFIGVALAGCFGTLFYLLGTLVAAQGQILKATLDTALNSSTFLSNDDRAQAMSLQGSGHQAGSSGLPRPMLSGPWKCMCGWSNQTTNFACVACGEERVA